MYIHQTITVHAITIKSPPQYNASIATSYTYTATFSIA